MLNPQGPDIPSEKPIHPGVENDSELQLKPQDHDPRVVPQHHSVHKEISSNISTDNILSVYQRGNSLLVYFTETSNDDTPAT